MTNKIELSVYKRGRGFMITLGERRIAGPKPIFYGKPDYSVKVNIDLIEDAISEARTFTREPKAQKAGEEGWIIKLTGVDEYGPQLEWSKPWTDFPVGKTFK